MAYTFDEQIFSDLYKDCYGFRCRNHEFYDASDDRKQEIWDYLLEELDSEMKAEEQRKNLAIEAFEEVVAKTMRENTVDRETAVRWLMAAHDDEYMDEDYFKYELGLPYSYNLVGAQAA